LSLIVEDGTGKVDAESYISVADASARHAALGNTIWADDTSNTEKEQALRRATQYMLQAYRKRWSGYRKTATQALDWPRSFVYLEPFIVGAVGPYPYLVSDTIVPTDIANACADLALKAAAGDLNPDIERAVIRKKIGPLEKEFDPYSPQSTQYRAINMALAPYLTGSSAMATLVRA